MPIAEPVDVEKALADPSQVFGSPLEIVRHIHMSKTDKLRLLGVWEADAKELETAAAGNMTGGEPSRLKEVRDTIRLLKMYK